jgi:NOL1/NOP2/fmu family ribosome biogenesis protein
MTAKEMLESQTSPIVKDRVGRYAKGFVTAIQDDGPFDLVILMAGTNDIGMDELPPHILFWTQQLHKICSDRKIPTVAILPPTVTRGKPRQALQQLKGLVRSWAQSANPAPLACLDSEELVPRTLPGHWEPEEFHLSPPGSQVLGRRLSEVIKPMLSRMRAAIPGRGNFRVLEPTPRSLDIVGQGSYQVGEAVEVWSNSRRKWCAGKVINVSGNRANQQIQVEMHLGGGRPAVKVLPSNNDGLRKAKRHASATPGPASPALQNTATPYAAAVPAVPVASPAQAVTAPQVQVSPQTSSPSKAQAPSMQVQSATLVKPQTQTASPSGEPTAAGGAAAGPTTPPQVAATLQEGDSVEVWSKQHKSWCPGKVQQVIDDKAVISLMLPNGVGATKALKMDSDELRMPDKSAAGDVNSSTALADAPLMTVSTARDKEYTVGEEVQVWSNSYCSWCDGKVIGFQDDLVQAEFTLPGGQTARKALSTTQGGMRRRRKRSPSDAAAPQDSAGAVGKTQGITMLDGGAGFEIADSLALDYGGELGLLRLEEFHQEPYVAGDVIEVWSNSSQTWCVGKVVEVANGLVHTNFTLPNGAIAKKLLPFEDENIRIQQVRRQST